MSIKKISLEKYIEYSNYEGSQHIAKEHSIFRILQVIKKEKAKNVLEIGLGIGTIYSAVREFSKEIKYFGTENNDFCLKSLEKNLSDSYNSLIIYESIEDVHFKDKIDVVIVDGKDRYFDYVKESISNNGVIIIEGYRQDQLVEIRKLFPESIDVHVITLSKNDGSGFFDSNHYQGGVKIIYVKPIFRQRINWFKQKVSTKYKYIIRTLRS
ncbi:methyltransferase [Polaribacter sp. IC073]|uniref:methyltransferase n=1 Tax=Polaribacter sp. IC073 TaxID=2508540 RepID=UPI0011BD56FE|nr:methyltransferase [Polaribacter sp. IC073]TXD49122.1 methyltransferase [Polaribacter sp. IC073]